MNNTILVKSTFHVFQSFIDLVKKKNKNRNSDPFNIKF